MLHVPVNLRMPIDPLKNNENMHIFINQFNSADAPECEKWTCLGKRGPLLCTLSSRQQLTGRSESVVQHQYYLARTQQQNTI